MPTTCYSLAFFILTQMAKEIYIIIDWMGNHCFKHKEFNSFMDGWDFLLLEFPLDDGSLDDYYVILK